MKKHLLIIAAALLSVASCTKKEAEAEKPESQEKRDENIVTLTKEAISPPSN